MLSQQLLIQLIALFVTHVFISFDFEKLNDVTCLLSSGTIRVVNQIYKSVLQTSRYEFKLLKCICLYNLLF